MIDTSSDNQEERLRYSAAYPTGRELMLEPRYGCAVESFAFGGEPRRGEPEGPARGRARAQAGATNRLQVIVNRCNEEGVVLS